MQEIFEQPSQPLVNQREAAFARLVARVIDTLNFAVDTRRASGQSSADIAAKIGCHRTALSRTLNGTTRNLTLRTISDILWATDFEPRDFAADPLEHICPNSPKFDYEDAMVVCGSHSFTWSPKLNIDDVDALLGEMQVIQQAHGAISQ